MLTFYDEMDGRRLQPDQSIIWLSIDQSPEDAKLKRKVKGQVPSLGKAPIRQEISPLQSHWLAWDGKKRLNCKRT